MSFIVGELTKILIVNLKNRTDSLSDQFNRIFMMKILLACSFCTGINWYKDSMNCIATGDISKSFMSSACWIQGVYIYEELQDRFDEVAYYGISKDVSFDGMLANGELCQTTPKFRLGRFYNSSSCKPLTKTFFLQYQWLPFLVAALAIIFYLPYMLHLHCNCDIINLKHMMEEGKETSRRILKLCFDRETNPLYLQRLRMFYSYLIKMVYIAVNVFTFVALDKALNGKFRFYGKKWLKWMKLKNQVMYDYMGDRKHPRPGHEVLPPFGYCEVIESAKDILRSHANHHKFVCELSQNILSQYALILIWVLVVIAFVVSVCGFLMLFINHLVSLLFVSRRTKMVHKLSTNLSLREYEYLEFLRRKDILVYGEVMNEFDMVEHDISDDSSFPCDTPPPEFEVAIS